MSGRHWYAFYPADYERDTAHLTLLEHGCYRRLMDHYYSSGKHLPPHVDRLFRLCRAFVPDEQAAIARVLEWFFREEIRGYFHPRIEQELEKARILSERGTKAGLASGHKRQQDANKTPTKTQPPHPPGEVSKNLLNGDGAESGKRDFTIKDPQERLARFQKTLAQSFPQDGWLIVASASNLSAPDHAKCLELCKAQARKIGKQGLPHAWFEALQLN